MLASPFPTRGVPFLALLFLLFLSDRLGLALALLRSVALAGERC